MTTMTQQIQIPDIMLALHRAYMASLAHFAPNVLKVIVQALEAADAETPMEPALSTAELANILAPDPEMSATLASDAIYDLGSSIIEAAAKAGRPYKARRY